MKKQLSIIMVLLLTIFIGFGIIIPVLPEMVQDTGATPFHLGMLLAVYSAMSFLLSPFWGGLSDRIGRRPVILIGLAGFSISFFLFGMAENNLTLMYVSRIFGGLFSGAATSCAMAYIADITTDEDRTKGMGLAGMSIGFGFIIGPAFGGLLSYFGNAAPFFASSALALLTFLFASVYLPESLPEEKRAGMNQPRPSRWTAFAGVLKYLYILSFIVSFTLAGLESTFQYFQMVKIDATPVQIGMMFAISGVVGAVIQGGVVRRYVKKGTEARTILIGLLISSAGFFLILFSADFWSATLFIAIFGIGNALIRPCVLSLITQTTKTGQGIATGLSSSMDSLGRIAGPLFGTMLFEINYSWPFLFGAVILILSIPLIYGFVTGVKKVSAAATQ